MEFIFFIAAFNALFFAMLLLQKKKSLHDKILFIWLIFLGLYTGCYAFFMDTLFTGYHLLSASFISLLMLHGPFLFLYISALMEPKWQFSSKRLLHFAPFLLFNLYILIASAMPELAERIRLDHTAGVHSVPMLFKFFLMLTALSGPVYIILSIRLFRKLDINIFNNLFSSDAVNHDWLRKLVYSFGVLWTLLIIVASIHHIFNLFSWIFCTNGLFFALSLFIILIGYFGLKQKEIFIQFQKETIEYITEPKVKYAGVMIKAQDLEEYAGTITNFMHSGKPYLDADLTLPQLATMVEIPAHHLSRVINEQFGINFFDFINQYRIEEVKLKIDNPRFNNLSLLGIAFESGFNSKSAFNRVFKKMTGITPSQYKNRH